jgi:transposase
MDCTVVFSRTRWRTIWLRRVGPSPADQAAEIARLRKELERVRMERDILKRAALIFGQATDRR